MFTLILGYELTILLYIAWYTGADPKIGKNMIFWRKIVIFHTKYPNNFRSAPP